MSALLLLACGLGALLLDQWGKTAIQAQAANFELNWHRVLRFRLVTHREPLYRNAAARAAFVAIWIAALVSVTVLAHAGLWFRTAGSLAGAAAALGGAASNLLDILKRRFIVDYIDLGWWPVFNLADVAILAGLAATLLG